MAVSFQSDVLPLFRQVDIDHMRPFGVLLDDYAYMSDPSAASSGRDHAHARSVYDFLSGASQPQMPLGGTYWSPKQLQLFQRWMIDGYQA